MKKILFMLSATFVGSIVLTKVCINLIDSYNISNEIETEIIDEDPYKDLVDNFKPSDDLLEQYKEEIKKSLDYENKYDNEKELYNLENQIKKEFEDKINNGSISFDNDVLIKIKDNIKEAILNNIRNNLNDYLTDNLKEEVIDNAQKELEYLDNATLNLGNSISVIKDDFKGAMENVIAIDYDGTDITHKVNFKIIENKNNNTVEVDNFDGEKGLGGNFSVIYYVTGTNNESIIGYKDIEIYTPIEIKLKSETDVFKFYQNIDITEETYTTPELSEIIDTNIISTSGNFVISWDIHKLMLDKDETQDVTITVYEADRTSNSSQIIVKFKADGHIYEGDGSSNNPFRIQDTIDLEYLQGKDLKANFIMISDLDFSNNSGFKSINIINEGYKFDGNYNTIENITLEITNLDNAILPKGDYVKKQYIKAYAGLFLEIIGELENITILNVKIIGMANSSLSSEKVFINIISTYILGDKNLKRVSVNGDFELDAEFYALNDGYISIGSSNILYHNWEGTINYFSEPSNIYGKYCIGGLGFNQGYIYENIVSNIC